MQTCSQKDLFATATAGFTPLVLELKKIQAPRRLGREDTKPLGDNFHIPSFKNSKQIIAKTPKGVPLDRPLIITSPEYQEWMEKAVRSLESQLLSMCQTGADATQQVLSRLSAMLSLLPADDSVNDLVAGSWTINRVAPGEEGATITIERLK